MKNANFLLIAVSVFFIAATLIGCSKDVKQTTPPGQLTGQWKFQAFLTKNGDTLPNTYYPDCDSCFTLTFSDSYINYFGRAGSKSVGNHVRFEGNKIIMAPFLPTLPYEGAYQEKFIKGLYYPGFYFIKMDTLKLTSTYLTDTLLFTKVP